MTTYYFTLKSTQFKSFFISIIVTNLNRISSIFLNNDTSLNIFIDSLENSVTFHSSGTFITNLICSFSNVTDFPVSIFNTISIHYDYFNPFSSTISIYKINLIDFIECKNVIILNSQGVPQINDESRITYIKDSDIIDFGAAELINTFIPTNTYNLTNKNYVDTLISTEKSLLLSSINYNKIIQPSNAVLNINGFPIGEYPLIMPDNIISRGYDGWYYSNSMDTSRFINWSFYSSINNIIFSDLNSLYFNIYINSNNTNIPSIIVFTKPINGSLYYSYSIYSISNENLQTLTTGYYTCYALNIPPITPNHIQIQLSLISSMVGPGETLLSNPSENILNISIYSNNILNYDFILNQVTIASRYGNENSILSNDSLYSFDTRSRLNRIFQYFFKSDSSLIPIR